MDKEVDIYRGERTNPAETFVSNVRVTVNGKILSPIYSQKVHNHSPDGFNWGYGGSGPAQLALAILLNCYPWITKDDIFRYYQDFKWEYVCKWEDTWEITSDEILIWLKKKKAVIEEN